jgi:hypothetical protein
MPAGLCSKIPIPVPLIFALITRMSCSPLVLDSHHGTRLSLETPIRSACVRPGRALSLVPLANFEL